MIPKVPDTFSSTMKYLANHDEFKLEVDDDGGLLFKADCFAMKEDLVMGSLMRYYT